MYALTNEKAYEAVEANFVLGTCEMFPGQSPLKRQVQVNGEIAQKILTAIQLFPCKASPRNESAL